MNTKRIPKVRRDIRQPISEEVHRGIFIHKENYGFIDGQDLYVRRDNINTALNKDLVEYVILEGEELIGGEKKYEAKITGIVERYRTQFTGEVVYKERTKTYILLDNPKLNKVVCTPKTDLAQGEKVLVELTNFDTDHLEGTIIKSIGHKSQPGVDIMAVLEECGISHSFPQHVEEAAAKIQLDIEGHRKDTKRRDITHLAFATIDPNNSKDFDDAIFVSKDGSNYKLYVAIADVWSYIRNSKELIEEAQNRSTSIYYLNSVIPMLPERLCNDFCSLVPNQERCAVVLEIPTDNAGEVIWDKVEVFPAIIKSRRRFTYDEVNEFFNGTNDFSKEDPEIKKSMELGFELYKLLEQQRINRGYVQLESGETQIVLDDQGRMISCHTYVRGHAQFMIENFMILANESVARYLTQRELPGVFRIHDRPEPNKIAAFINEVRKLNFVIQHGDENINQKVIFRWFQENKHHPLIEMIGTLLLRSLPKAIYSVTNSGHFGINLENYLHFTSPIRRYPDVIVHKILWEYVFEGKEKPKPDNVIYKTLSEISKHCTEKEIEATEVSRTIETMKIVQYLNTHLDKIFKARVISTLKHGAFVKLDELNVEGFVKSREPLKLGDFVLIKPLYNNKEMKLIKVL